MEIKERYFEESNAWEIFLFGEIDIYNAPELKEKLHEIIENKPGSIILDCTNLKYIDSTGLGVLISILKRVKAYDGDVVIRHLKPYIRKIFLITGLDKVFSIESEDEVEEQ